MYTYKQNSDSELIRLFSEGNVNAFEELTLRYKDKIYSSIYFLVKDKYLAEDIFQDVFYKIIDTIHSKKYNDEGKFVSWAMRIAHNMCVDHFRKIKRKPVIHTGDGLNIFDWIQVNNENMEEKIIRTQSHDRITSLLSMLPDEQKEVIILRHFADLSFKEIAELTNCSINTALGRMRYGLINLRKMMTEKQIAI